MILITRFINDYNLWMGGVDKTDQMISYYFPNLRCMRNWMPMFVQLLSMIRSNSYIAIKHCNDRIMKDKQYDGKKFTMEFIKALMRRSYALNYSTVTIPCDSVLLCKDSNVPCRRRSNIGHSQILCKIIDKQVRFEKPESPHQFKNSDSHKLRKRCIWCRYLEQEAKTTGSDVYTTQSRVRVMCQYCDVYICSEAHFDAYHTPPRES